MKFHLVGTVKRLNIEHRTSNIEHPILMTLRFIDLKTSEPQNPPKADKFQRVDLLCSVFFKLTEFIIRCWTFNVRCSMFIFWLTRYMKLAKDKVSFKSRLAAFQDSGWAET